jgi:hypothetical protein
MTFERLFFVGNFGFFRIAAAFFGEGRFPKKMLKPLLLTRLFCFAKLAMLYDNEHH